MKKYPAIGDTIKTLEGGHVQIVKAIWKPNRVVLDDGKIMYLSGIRPEPDPRKWTPVFVVQGNYGYGHGWEDLCESESYREARDWLKDYRHNERGYPHRMIRRLEQNYQEKESK